MINFLSVFFLVFLFTGTGWYLVRFFQLSSTVEKLSVSFLLGSGLGTYLWFLLYLLGISLTFTSLILACCLVSLAGLLTSRHTKVDKKETREKWAKLDWSLFVLTVIGLISTFIIGSYNPITAWDSMALYDSRAHMIVLNHSLKDIVDSSYYLSYPLFISLLHAAVYFIGGGNPQSLHAVIFAAFLGIIYGRLRAWTNLRLALLGTFLNFSIYELLYHSTIAYANLAYTAFLVAGIFYAVSEENKSPGRFLILAGLMLGLSTWVRTTEVFWLLGTVLIFWYGYRLRHLSSAIYALILLLIIRQGWSFYYASLVKALAVPPLSPVPIFSQEMLTGILINIPQILTYLKNNLIIPYLGFWGMAAGVSILSLRLSIPRSRSLVFFVAAAFLTAAAGTAVYSTFFPTWFAIGDSVRRMLMFISPLTMTAGVAALFPLLRRDKHAR